ncbi:MAG: penicillin acylase family protein, partial [Chloroflexi bacterium]|nr:penicillin acylase family protein [Chloroflexota bacterium]
PPLQPGAAPSAATQPPSPRPATAPDAPTTTTPLASPSRLVVAFGAAAAAWAMLAPGQSGQPGSPHYGDLITPWLSGDYLEIAWTVEEGTAVSPHTTPSPRPRHTERSVPTPSVILSARSIPLRPPSC